MIKFFRNIRRRLLRENRFTRYLLYAIGEIILVVIGILIALQINEWNNERNRREWQKESLSQLRTDLEQSQTELEEIKAFYLENAQASAKVLRAFWLNKNPYPQDSIRSYLFSPGASRVYSPPLGTAKALINSGKIDLLKHSRLKTAIITYVERVDYLLKDIQRYEETYYRKGIEKLSEEIPNDLLSLDEVREKLEERIKMIDTSERYRSYYERGLFTTPDTIEKVPFKTDLKTIFDNEELFIAYDRLYIAHRNRYFRYDDILDSTNQLLEALQNIDQIETK